MRDLGLAWVWDEFSNVAKWFDNIRAREAYAKTYYRGTRLTEIYDGADLGAGENRAKVVKN